MGDLVLKGATSGQITLTPTGVAGTNTLTLPAKTGNIITSADSGTVTQTMMASGVAGNGPAFSAYANATTSCANSTFTKLLFAVEEFDTNNNFASSTFTPTNAGYYQISAGAQIAGGSGVFVISIYKNGARFKDGSILYNSASTGGGSVVSTVINMNGSTDTIDIYAFQSSGGSLNASSGQNATYFSAALVRSA